MTTPQDTQVVSKSTLDDEYASQFNREWLLTYPDGRIEEFDTEDQACEKQRSLV